MPRRTLLLLAAALVLAGVGGYLYVQSRSLVLAFSEADLQARLSALPPYTRTHLRVFHVTIDNPRVTLHEGSDRIHAGSDVAVSVDVGGRSGSLAGSIEASGGVRYEPTTGEFFLSDATVERLSIPGLPEPYAAPAGEAVARAVRAYYDRHAVYTLQPTDLKKATARALLKDVVVADRHLVLTLGL